MGVIVSLESSENNDKIDNFGKQLSMHIAASNPLSINTSDIKKETLDKEIELIEEELKNSEKLKKLQKK